MHRIGRSSRVIEEGGPKASGSSASPVGTPILHVAGSGGADRKDANLGTAIVGVGASRTAAAAPIALEAVAGAFTSTSEGVRSTLNGLKATRVGRTPSVIVPPS